MNILLHTIALEPARWTPQRVSQKLTDLLPRIAAVGFRELEIFEPHLGAEPGSAEIRDALAANGQRPVILSSYVQLNPSKTSDTEFSEQMDLIGERVRFYGFRKIRIFPGAGMQPQDADGVVEFTRRARELAMGLPDVEILLETHDGSLADDPEGLVGIVGDIHLPNVGLLFQPTFFQDAGRTLEQFRVQKPHIRHLHLQNRNPDLSFATMRDGIVPWPEIFRELGGAIDASIEFVPAGICGVEAFDPGATLDQIRAEAEAVRSVCPMA